MKILTVGASPYLLVRNGRMNSDVIRALKASGHEVCSAVWHHDEGYFLPDDMGVSWFENASTGEPIAQLYPFLPKTSSSDATLYEIMKKVQPQLVISIGDYKEVDFIYSIKAMYPQLFKWIAVFPVDTWPVNENHKDRIEYADYVISTSNFGWDQIRQLCNVQGEFLPYGPDPLKFVHSTRPRNERPVYLVSSQNSQAGNIPAFIQAMSNAKGQGGLNYEGKIHTNLYDPGDYDLELLIHRHGAVNVHLPEYYCSIKDGPSDEEFASIVGSADFFVETSVKSATALSMLEAMRMGCVPIGMSAGRIGEILRLMPEEFRYSVDFEIFVGAHEEHMNVISVSSLTDRILRAKKELFDNPEYLEAASSAARAAAEQFSNQNFIDGLLAIANRVSFSTSPIALESF